MTPVHRFQREAMHTVFDAAFSGGERDDCRHAAGAAFAAIARVESILSRFLPGSDVWQINALRAGESLRVRPETVACLEIAAEIAARTDGAFDPGLGAFLDAIRDADGHATRPLEDAATHRLLAVRRVGVLRIDRDRLEVRCEREGLQLDLGAIGKGFALDEAARTLREEWEIESFRLAASTSTILAAAPPARETGWKAGLGLDANAAEITLHNEALSCSGTANRGAHLLDARTGRAAANYRRTWVRAKTAAESDALSTAFMALAPEEIIRVIAASPDVEAWAETLDDRPQVDHFAGGLPQTSTSM